MKSRQHTEKIFTVENFLSKEECEHYISLSEEVGYEIAKVNTESGQRVLTQVRNNNRVLYNNEALAQLLWEKAKPFIPEKIGNSTAIGFNELFRFYRYEPGQQFRGHFDQSYIRNAEEVSFVTFMIYLNDDFEGGETTFQDFWIEPKQGMALIFFHDLYHSGREVSRGIKYVLRTDVMYRLSQ
ncbi:oxidoreductase, 2OG-Fe(II) oxygenase [Rhodocytophaga rosea]|uniref:Oxidoreductase, 2OG-Fe(II) oxygenase n=1 Tax=Rhodocytophaga rosea TaxID=2704465 RepID=A0A6C0GD46_9BACT|nr:2OG-Fe(II) oxygenase [Rhodocytophaga rosea]QHT65891.1 oxidoreductase, 2OG-Fe(II) oxygenase [Rhodocytophaga rosea]